MCMAKTQNEQVNEYETIILQSICIFKFLKSNVIISYLDERFPHSRVSSICSVFEVYLNIISLIQYLQQVFAVQIPLLDAVVSGAAEENVPLHH